MAFSREQARLPLEIGDLEFRVFKPKPGSATAPSVEVEIQVIMSNGEIIHRRGDLLPHLSAQHKNWLQAIAQAVFDTATTEILP